MKLHIITNQLGYVIATMNAEPVRLDKSDKHMIRVQIKPMDDAHKLHEAVDVPDDFGGLKPDQLHLELRKHLAKMGLLSVS
jgi:hypothetical protein